MQRTNVFCRGLVSSMLTALSLSLSSAIRAEENERSDYIESLWGTTEELEQKLYPLDNRDHPAWSRLAFPSARLAWGNGAVDGGTESIAIGSTAATRGDFSIAIGAQTKSNGTYALAIGTGAVSNGASSIAMGFYARTDLAPEGQSYRDGHNIAIGNSARVSGGEQATALGYSAHAYGAFAVAIGSGAKASRDSVAIGRGSVADEADVVSVGRGRAFDFFNSPMTRKITNVSYGVNDTDAANTGQVNLVDFRVTTVDQRVTNVGQRVTDVDQRVLDVYKVVTNVGERVTDVDQRVANLQADVSPLPGNVMNLQSSVATLLEGVTVLDGLLDRATDGSARIKGGDGQAVRLTNLAAGSADGDAVNIAQHNAVKTFVTDVDQRVTNLQADVSPLPGNVVNLQSSVATLQEGITVLDGLLDRATDGSARIKGADGQAVRLTNLAAGSADGDAVNIAQHNAVKTLATESSTGFSWTRRSLSASDLQAVATGIASIAAGSNAYSSGYSVALGAGAKADQGRSIAIGSNVLVGTRLGELAGEYGIGIGTSAQSLGGGSIAIGGQSKATKSGALALGNLAGAEAENGVAIGAVAKAKGHGSVALGYGSQAEGINEVSVGGRSTSGDLRRYISNVADGTLHHHVATLGQLQGETTKVAAELHAKLDGLLRREDGTIRFDGQHAPIRLTNIAEGYSANDAVNYTQLLRLSDTLTAQGQALTELGNADRYIQSLGDEERPYDAESEAAQPTGRYSMALGAYAHSAGESSVALGSGSATTEEAMYGMAIGYGSSVSGERSTALGYFANGVGEESLALGNEAQSSGARSMAVGHGARAEADGSFALGHESVAREAHTISVGDVDSERRITNVQDGRDPTDAVNIRQLHAALGEARVSAFTSFVGGLRVDSNTGVRVLDLDMHGAPVRVSGVASGQAEHDAVNVGQLKVIQDRLDAFANRSEAQSAGVYGRSAAPGTDASSSQATRNRTRAGTADDALPSQVEEAVAVAKSYADEAVAQAASSSKAYTDEKVTNLVSNADFETFRSDANTRIAGLTRRVSKVGAMGAAMAGMAGAIAAAPGTESRVSGAVGNYRGEGAFALGFSQRIPGNGAILVGGSLAGGESSGTIGVSFGW